MKRFAYFLFGAVVFLLPLTRASALQLENPINPANSSFIPCIDIGDVNGDGVDDLVASCPGSGSQTYLVAYSGADGSILYQKGAPPNYWVYGAALQPLGNYGGLPTPDFAVTSVTGTSTDGAVFILEGATGDILSTIPAPATQTDGDFGARLFLADVAGDSTPDFIVGAPYGGTNGGRIYVYDGATTALVDTIEPPTSETDQTFDVYSILPDLTGDGVPEIGAASPYLTVSGQTNAGAAYIFSGADRSLYRTITLASPQQDDHFEGPYPVGDLNGDGKGDYACAYGTTAARATCILFSGLDGSVIDTIPAPDINAYDWGRSVVGIDNITTDSVNEIVIGTQSGGSNFAGTVYVYNGATRALVTSFGAPVSAGYYGGQFGAGLHLVGDIDHDGKQDVAIPAVQEGYGVIYLYTQAGSPASRISPFDLGEYKVGSTPVEKTTPIYNYGFSDLNLNTTAIGGPDASDFSLSTDATPTTLSAGQSTTFGFSPASTVKGYKDGLFSVQAANGSSTTLGLTLEAYARPTGPDDRLAYLASVDQVMLVDFVSGERDVISGHGIGSGQLFPGAQVSDVLIEDSNNLIVSAGYQYFRVDRTTGDRTVLNVNPLNDGVQGYSDSIVAMDWESPGVLIVLIGGSLPRLDRVTLSSMAAQVVSSSTVGTGLNFYTYGSDMCVAQNGDILLLDFSSQTILRVDPTTGNRTKLNSSAIPYSISISQISTDAVALGEFSGQSRFLSFGLSSGTVGVIANPGFYPTVAYCALATLPDGNLIAYGGNNDSILHVNTTTGDVSYVATPTLGLGPTLPTGDYYIPAGLRLLVPAILPSRVQDWNLF